MGFYKLREWVGTVTVTGKGDRWGRNREGRSEPAFLSASTLALPPSTCTARQEAGRHHLRPLFCCEAGQLLALCSVEACAGRRVRRLCLPAAALFCGLCVRLHWLVQQAVCLLAFAMPCPLPISTFLPPFSFALPPVHSMCARIEQTVCKLQDCPVGSCSTGLQRRPVRRFLTFFFLQSPLILGHGVV